MTLTIDFSSYALSHNGAASTTRKHESNLTLFFGDFKLTSDIEDGRAFWWDSDDLWLSGYGMQANPPEDKWRLKHVDGDKFTLNEFNYDLSSLLFTLKKSIKILPIKTFKL